MAVDDGCDNAGQVAVRFDLVQCKRRPRPIDFSVAFAALIVPRKKGVSTVHCRLRRYKNAALKFLKNL